MSEQCITTHKKAGVTEQVSFSTLFTASKTSSVSPLTLRRNATLCTSMLSKITLWVGRFWLVYKLQCISQWELVLCSGEFIHGYNFVRKEQHLLGNYWSRNTHISCNITLLPFFPKCFRLGKLSFSFTLFPSYFAYPDTHRCMSESHQRTHAHSVCHLGVVLFSPYDYMKRVFHRISILRYVHHTE